MFVEGTPVFLRDWWSRNAKSDLLVSERCSSPRHSIKSPREEFSFISRWPAYSREPEISNQGTNVSNVGESAGLKRISCISPLISRS